MKKTAITFLLLFLFMTVTCTFIYHIWSKESLRATKHNLRYSRGLIGGYENAKNKKPQSLSNLLPFMKGEDDNTTDDPFYLSEMITNSNKESSVLDGTGGWYYNSETGELKVNLTKPLKKYFIFYFGDNKDEIPADW